MDSWQTGIRHGGEPSVGLPVVDVQVPSSRQPSLPLTVQTLDGPIGLAQALLESRSSTPLRFWVVDNSGSMAEADGARLAPRPGGGFKVVPCTRWEELRDVVYIQAQLALAVDSRIDVHLLNPTNTGARQFMSLGLERSLCASEQGSATIQDLNFALASSPTGSTPLTEAVQTIYNLVEPLAPTLRNSGQQVVFVLATDGLPNDPASFLVAVSSLQRLGCIWLVVRLCTSSDDVIDYWNDVDSKLEAPLEVLDDAAAEAKEVARYNPWLTYGFQLHLVRTAGMRHKLFDLLDEQPLIGSQTAEMISLLLGCGPLPNPDAEWIGFQERVGVLLVITPLTYCPVKKEMKPWIDLDELRRKYGGSVKKPLLWGRAVDADLPAFPLEFAARPAPGTQGVLAFTLKAKKLARKDTWSKNDPFFAISRWCGEGHHAFLANSEALQNTTNPCWRTMYLPRTALAQWDPAQGRIRFDVFDFEKDHHHVLIGFCWVSLDELISRGTSDLELHTITHSKSQGILTVQVEALL